MQKNLDSPALRVRRALRLGVGACPRPLCAPAQISGYLGKNDVFDKAIAAFAIAYADQSERDHAVLKKAVRSGRVQVVME
jgi:Uncharacterized protein conserved in bacteria (DUF2252)